MTRKRPVDQVLREHAPRVLGTLVRRYGDFDRCEDAVQEALVAAATRWRRDGVPEQPLGWLVTVASRRFLDDLRADTARQRRERSVVAAIPRDALVAAPADAEPPQDDTLALMFLCCHPALTPPSQLALTLRAVSGLTTSEIANAFLVPEATMGQRISRAKARLREARAPFGLPSESEFEPRLQVVLQVLYLLFNEGYSATSGPDLRRGDLTGEALRLMRSLRARVPESGEVDGLLALMLLTEARSAARTTPAGDLVPLAEQDRSRWDADAIAEGVELVTRALAKGHLGPYLVQAAIAAVHAEAPDAESTDWPQILALYEILERLAPNPVTALNRAVAVGMVRGPYAGLALLSELEQGVLAGNHRLLAVRAHLLERAGETAAASALYREAAGRARSLPERRFLLSRAAAGAEPSSTS